jgi:hypothetical protein
MMNQKFGMCSFVMGLIGTGGLFAAAENWSIESRLDWIENTRTTEGVLIEDDQARSQQAESRFTSKVKRFEQKHSLRSITFKQTAAWDNWREVPNVGLDEMRDALIFLPVGEGEYYMLGRHAKYQRRRVRNPDGSRGDFEGPPLSPEDKEALGGYHAWHSTDMKTWTHGGPVSTFLDGAWMTTAEYADGKFYLYYDRPNDQDPHLWVDDDLMDGKVGVSYGRVLNDPTEGSDAGVIRDEDGGFNIIYENWDYNNARTHAWDAPVAGLAKSPDGIQPFVIQDHWAVDERTTPTGEIGTYTHPESKIPFEYEIHTPEQNAYGDWTAIKVGGNYYLFCDYDPVGGHIKVGRFTSDSLEKRFEFVGEFGDGHPDPSVGFAEGQFYLIQQRGNVDFVSPGPWVHGVQARVGVDTSGNGKIDQWTKWRVVKERYSKKPGFARIVDTAPATLDVSSLPAGHGFAFEYRTSAVAEQTVNVVMESVEVTFD